MKKILISRAMTEAVMERANATYDVTLRESTAPMKPAEMRSSLVLYDGMIPTLGDMFSADIFAEFGRPKCKILANFGVGYNHIDVAAARDHGITVTNTPGAVTDATADIGMTLLLMSARRAGEGDRLVRTGKWTGWTPTQMLGSHVTGKTVGIIGMGRIGQAIARRCHFGFGMKVLFVNRSPKEVDFPATQVESLEALAAEADYLVAATPGGADTTHLIGEAAFAAMKPTAHFINISRGEVVDEAALVTALQNRSIAGAGLDVYENEPTVPDTLKALENVTLLPHLGTATEEVRTAMGMMSLDNLDAFFAGETPPNAL
ncbi:2-hydroxyacid dehydrogenase [Lentibacter sp. XHP0401]|uniref:2-hydroxyacid dehydrogenase n=1 Tax=Lentibacter sp. XHP0401 TaxID=2984334 RepID=UPI0021E714F6|nr:D-glycerate dehydrogenase [Lentibacter sp. XHP0401]MCV2893225.1 D-glycerate dehydrogenase [Lentibacter sp. XHP0401]